MSKLAHPSVWPVVNGSCGHVLEGILGCPVLIGKRRPVVGGARVVALQGAVVTPEALIAHQHLVVDVNVPEIMSIGSAP